MNLFIYLQNSSVCLHVESPVLFYIEKKCSKTFTLITHVAQNYHQETNLITFLHSYVESKHVSMDPQLDGMRLVIQKNFPLLQKL